MNPLVSISCITYNHVRYIRQCLDGFIMQKTSFPFEILIHDDASIDGTAEIIQEYEHKYPNTIRAVYEKENQWVKGRRGSSVFNFPRAKGKYIALCEGDDYWIDPLKLQKQVDFLEEHIEVSYLFTGRVIVNEKEGFQYEQTYRIRKYDTIDILSGFNPGIQSVCFRKECVENINWNLYNGVNGDRLFPFLCSLQGSLFVFNDITSVYRMTGIGVSTKIETKDWFAHASFDFYNFHQTVGVSNTITYCKGEANYLMNYLFENKHDLLNSIVKSYRMLRSINSDMSIKKYVLIIVYVIMKAVKTIIRMNDVQTQRVKL